MSVNSLNSFGSSPGSSPLKRPREGEKAIKVESPKKKPRRASEAPRLTDAVHGLADEFFFEVARSKTRSLQSSPEKKGSSPDVSPVRQQLMLLRTSDKKENPTPKSTRRQLHFEDAMELDPPPALPSRKELISQVLQGSLPEPQPLSTREREKIAEIIEQGLAQFKEPQYVFAKRGGSPRDLVIDPQRNRFIVLSGDAGDLNVAGGERRVTAATGFTFKESEIQISRLVHLYMLEDRFIGHFKRQLDVIINDLYIEDQFLSIEYETKEGDTCFSVFEKRYEEGNLELAGKKKPLDPVEIRAVIRQVTKTLSFLHKNNLSHGDITRGNTLITNRDQGAIQAKLTDFGMTFSLDESDSNWPKQFKEGYGSIQYSAPECFGMSEKLKEPADQHVAEEMFAMGCLIYLMLYPKEGEIYWDHQVCLAIERGTAETQEAAKNAYIAGMRNLLEKRKTEPEARQNLIDICIALLRPDPSKRMTLATLQTVM